MQERIYKYLEQLTDKDYVLAGTAALSYSGVSLCNVYMPQFYTKFKKYNGLCIGSTVQYFYKEHIDFINYVTNLGFNSHIKVPTQERALIEVIKDDFNTIDEGTFLEALRLYYIRCRKDLSKLKEVADFFKVEWSTVEYWIEESLEM